VLVLCTQVNMVLLTSQTSYIFTIHNTNTHKNQNSRCLVLIQQSSIKRVSSLVYFLTMGPMCFSVSRLARYGICCCSCSITITL
jgi:hypothetical protein